MARIKASGSNPKINAGGGKSAYRSTNQAVRTSTQPTATEYTAPPTTTLYREHFNVPFDKVGGAPPYKAGPTPVPTNSEPFVYYGEVSLVPADSETTVASYVAAGNQVIYIQGFQACGDCDAMFTLYVDNQIVSKWRTSPADLSAYMNFASGTPVVQPGKQVKITVICLSGGNTHYGTLFGYYVAY